MTFFLEALVWISVPVIVWFAIRQWVPKRLTAPLYAAVVAAFFCVFIVVSASYQERRVESDIAEFDLVHAGAELTDFEKEERQQLFLKIIHDTGRTFAPITAVIGGFLYFILIWLNIFIVNRVINGVKANAGEMEK